MTDQRPMRRARRRMENIDGLIRVRLPLPLWTDHVNCFLLEGDDGWTIVDTGIYAPEVLDCWQKTFARHGVDPRAVRRILITHSHMDHVGAAGALQEWTGAQVLISAADREACNPRWWQARLGDESPHHHFGMPKALKARLEEERIACYRAWMHPLPHADVAEEGSLIRAGNDRFQVLSLPGHSDGHLCLWSDAEGVMLAGDVFVAPNNLATRCGNPFAAFLASMHALQDLEITLVFPGHGDPFARANERLALIREYRKSQAASVRDLCREKTVYEIYEALQDKGAIPEHYFGMGEIYYMLEYLLDRGEVEKTRRAGAWVYARTNLKKAGE